MAAPEHLLAAIPGLAGPLATLRGLDPTLLPAQWAFDFLLVFARLGTALWLLPGLGELWVPARIRLVFALILSFVLLPTVMGALPETLPAAPLLYAPPLARELLAGLFLGFCIRATTSAIMTTGSFVALQAGLANALQPGVVTPDAATTLGVFLGLSVLAFIANSGLDRTILAALANSYTVIPPPAAGSMMPPLDDLLRVVVRTVAGSFAIGFWIAFPVALAGLLLNLGLGLANRFMPSLQVYFLSVPAAILMVLLLLGLGAPVVLHELSGALEHTIARLGGADE